MYYRYISTVPIRVQIHTQYSRDCMYYRYVSNVPICAIHTQYSRALGKILPLLVLLRGNLSDIIRTYCTSCFKHFYSLWEPIENC